MGILRGIDVSSYQGQIDWNLVKDNINFAILRVGYGMYDAQKDVQFEKNYTECKKLGIPVGIYHYSYAKNVDQARREANLVLNWLKDKELQLPVYFDIEDPTQMGLGKENLTNICIEFCSIIEKAGFWAGVYANKHWFTSILDKELLESKYTIWVAQYYDKCTYEGKYDIWQNSSSGRVNGVMGDVDTNYMYRDLITEIGNKKSNIDVKVEESTNAVKQEKPTANNELNYKKFVSTNNIVYTNSVDANDKKNGKTLSTIYHNKQMNIIKVYNNAVLAENIGFFNVDDIRIVDNANATQTTYKVVAGDTLGKIATKFNTTIDSIAILNGVKDKNQIYVGQVLKINSNVTTSSKTYIVKEGDTLSQIAKDNNTTVSYLVSRNNITNINKIFVGQKIVI